MTKKDYLRLIKSNTDIFDSKNMKFQDNDILSYNDCLVLVNLYRLIIEKQNNKIKTLKKRRDKWKYIATVEEFSSDVILSSKDDKKNIFKYLYNPAKEQKDRKIKLENKKLKQKVRELEERVKELEEFEELYGNTYSTST